MDFDKALSDVVAKMNEENQQLTETYHSLRKDGLLSEEILNSLNETYPQGGRGNRMLINKLEKEYLGDFTIRFNTGLEHLVPFHRMYSSYVRLREMPTWTKERLVGRYFKLFGQSARHEQYLDMLEAQYQEEAKEKKARVISKQNMLKRAKRPLQAQPRMKTYLKNGELSCPTHIDPENV